MACLVGLKRIVPYSAISAGQSHGNNRSPDLVRLMFLRLLR
jgi:hypothetical protein